MSNAEKEEVSFSDAQWFYLPDVNQGSYNNIIQYYTTPLKQQFIDYHNAYLRIPMQVLMFNGPLSASSGAQTLVTRPPTVALRQSVLNLITNINVATDQGQTIVNDINTQFINNIRLEVENDEGWMRSDGPMLDYAYDRWDLYPAKTTAPSTFGYSAGNQTAPSYRAAQGIEPGALFASTGAPGTGIQTGFPPLTNDPNEKGNNTFGTFTVAFTGGAGTTGANPIITSFNNVTVTIADNTLPVFAVTFSDGRVAYFPYTMTGTAVTSVGGINIGGSAANIVGGPIGPAAGQTYVLQAVGYTEVLGTQLESEMVTIPLVFNVITAATGTVAGASTLASIGGVSLVTTSTGSVAMAYGQVAGINPNCNVGFLDRVTLFQNSAEYLYYAPGTQVQTLTNTYGCHSYWYRAIIPLKLLHDFFRQLDFPVINVGFNFQFSLAQSNGPVGSYIYPPFQTSNNTYLITGAANVPAATTLAPTVGGGDDTPYPIIFYGQEAGSATSTRLYYRVVKFSPSDNTRSVHSDTYAYSTPCISCAFETALLLATSISSKCPYDLNIPSG